MAVVFEGVDVMGVLLVCGGMVWGGVRRVLRWNMGSWI